jgi:putative protease
MPTYEDEHGTYIMNSKDLRAVQHVKRLMEIGVESLKIEGRTKSYYYAARTAQVYRRAIDDAAACRDFNMGLMDELEGMANRGFTEGFYRRHVPGEYQNYETGNSVASKQLFVADVCKVDRQTRRLSLTIKNKICIGDDLVLLTPAGNISFQLQDMFQPDSTEPLRVAPGSGYQVDIVLPELAHNQLAIKALDKGLLVRNLPAKVGHSLR